MYRNFFGVWFLQTNEPTIVVFCVQVFYLALQVPTNESMFAQTCLMRYDFFHLSVLCIRLSLGKQSTVNHRQNDNVANIQCEIVA